MESIPSRFISEKILTQVSEAMASEFEQTKKLFNGDCNQNEIDEKIKYIESKGLIIDITMQGLSSIAVCEHENIRMSYMPLINYMSFRKDNVIETMPCDDFMQYLCYVEKIIL